MPVSSTPTVARTAEGASTLRRQDLIFAILKEVAEDGEEIMGLGTIEVLSDGMLRAKSECVIEAGVSTGVIDGLVGAP